ncbi:MAG: PDGLE domain-containing protein [bacterium]|nr:PDGLE domain-containing protein [bacterium]MDD5756733.1 PDGLE domain-containing protein [bacterium]
MNRRDILIGLGIALLVAIILSPFASPHPDGLERVAEDKGFLEKGEGKPLVVSPIPDYTFPGIQNEKAATAMAGIAGTLVVFGLGYGLAKLLKK